MMTWLVVGSWNEWEEEGKKHEQKGNW